MDIVPATEHVEKLENLRRKHTQMESHDQTAILNGQSLTRQDGSQYGDPTVCMALR